jgi:hypothetical protein
VAMTSASAIEAAHARAARNGLTLELGEVDAGCAWPGKRYASVRLMSGRDVIAAVSHSYHDEASKQRALSICCERVYFRP